MKAVVLIKVGPPEVLQLQEVAKPAPKDHEVLIRVHATTVTAGEVAMRGLKVPIPLRLPLRIYLGFVRQKPVILGQEVAGEIEAVGKDVTRFKEGDQVAGWCGLRLGGYAEYVCLSARGALAIKPSNMTYEEAATLPVGGLDATHLIRGANIRSGEKVLIIGAGGSIGTYALQLAKHFGAHVTGVDSTAKLDLLRSMGADRAVDYTREDVSRRRDTYDVVIDVIGKSSYSHSVRMLTPRGRFLAANPYRLKMAGARLAARGSSKTVIPWTARSTGGYLEDFDFLRELIEAGKIRSAIDRRFPLEEVAEAHKYVEAGHKKGHVVITVEHSS